MMAEKSPSVPFLPKPENLSPSDPGYKGFDPLGLTDYLSADFMKEAEIKHCRVAMLAFLGWIVTDFGIVLPGRNWSPIEAHDQAIKIGSLQQVLIFVSIAEIFSSFAVIQMLNGSGRKPGYFGFDPLGFVKDEQSAKKFGDNEIENGRAAMLAFGGIVTQAVLYGKSFPYF